VKASKEREVLLTAAVLRDFVPAQVCAYCTADEPTVRAVLQAHPGLFREYTRAGSDSTQSGSRRWEVISADRLEQELVEPDTPEGTAGPDTAHNRSRLSPIADDAQERRRFAEELLINSEPDADPERRSASARLATTYLRQYLAELAGARSRWWNGVVETVEPPPDVRGALLLAELIIASATGSPVVQELVGSLNDWAEENTTTTSTDPAMSPATGPATRPPTGPVTSPDHETASQLLLTAQQELARHLPSPSSGAVDLRTRVDLSDQGNGQ
jgi:hypothetical protein